MNKLYINPYKIGIYNKESWQEFLKACAYNVVSSYYGEFNPTYLDEACLELQFDRGRRSLEELLILVNTYFPEVTVEELASELFSANYVGLYCYTSGLYVFYYNARLRNDCYVVNEDDDSSENEIDTYDNSNTIRKFSYINKDIDEAGTGKYSFREIITLAGLCTDDLVAEYESIAEQGEWNN